MNFKMLLPIIIVLSLELNKMYIYWFKSLPRIDLRSVLLPTQVRILTEDYANTYSGLGGRKSVSATE